MSPNYSNIALSYSNMALSYSNIPSSYSNIPSIVLCIKRASHTKLANFIDFLVCKHSTAQKSVQKACALVATVWTPNIFAAPLKLTLQNLPATPNSSKVLV